MTDILPTQQALSDIQALKQAILRSRNKVALTADSVDTHLVLNSMAFAVSGGIGVTEMIRPELVNDLIFLSASPDTRYTGLAFVGAALVSLLAVAYGYLSFKARGGKTTLADFSDRHFAYFKNMSALSDIFVKFCMFALLVFADKPQWVAPLFVLFIGDLVFQGRVLILSTLASTIFGLASFATAFAMFYSGVMSVTIPASLGLMVSACSLVNILNFRRKLFAAQE